MSGLYLFNQRKGYVFSRTGQVYCLNLVRRITLWRRFRHWLDWPEVDTMIVSGSGAIRAGCVKSE